MIYKSYLVEENIKILKNNIILIYGENRGLINDLKTILIKEFSNEIIRFDQDSLIKNPSIFINELKNVSLFEKKKVLFINNINDKILKLIEEINFNPENNKIYLFADILEKKSILRATFEKSDKCDVIPCYNDNEINIKKMIADKLAGYSGITPKILNYFIEESGLDRIKINNEIEKVKTFFLDKKITYNYLEKLFNNKTEENFNEIKENALKGDKNLTNKLLSSTTIENDKLPLYLNILNQRLFKLKEIFILSKEKSINEAINSIKPPIFWKDKPNFQEQCKLWSLKKVNSALNITYNLEKNIKSDSTVNKEILFKKLLIDVCLLATT